MSLRRTFIFSGNCNSTELNPCGSLFNDLLDVKPLQNKRVRSYGTKCGKSVGYDFPFISPLSKPLKRKSVEVEEDNSIPYREEVFAEDFSSGSVSLIGFSAQFFPFDLGENSRARQEDGSKTRSVSVGKYNFDRELGVVKIILMLLMVIQLSKETEAQPLAFGEGWMIGLNAGAVTFFGTLSHYENGDGLTESFKRDSDFGMSYMFGKMISRGVSLRANYLSAHMKGSNSSLAYSFTNKLDEVSFNADLSLIRLFIPRYIGRIDPYFTVGGGFLQVDTYRERIPDDFMSEIAINESAMFLTTGLGIKYEINTNWKIDLYGGLRATDSGLIDATTATDGVNDMYSWISAGVVYVLVPAASGKSSRGMPCPDW